MSAHSLKTLKPLIFVNHNQNIQSLFVGATALSITALSIMTLSIRPIFQHLTLDHFEGISIHGRHGIQHNDTQHMNITEYHCAECHD